MPDSDLKVHEDLKVDTSHGDHERFAHYVDKNDMMQAAVFGTPIRVSSAAAPYPSGYAAGDDFSWIITDKHYAHIGWGDSRNGPVQVWYGRIPLSSSTG